MNTILFSFRDFRKLEEKDVASSLSITIQDYKELESGIEKISTEIALRLSDLYTAPPQIFLESNFPNYTSVVYSYCHFENSNGYAQFPINENEELIKAEETIVQLLSEEIKHLREENFNLRKFVLG